MKKKIILLLLIILTTASCGKQKSNQEQNTEERKENTKTEEKITYEDNNPIKLGIYMYHNSYTNRELLTEYTTSWNLNQDLCSLEIFYTNEQSIKPTNIKTLWNEYYQTYENINNYKIGYLMEFNTEDKGNIKKYIMSPEDTKEIYGYMQIYLYDDIHQEDGAWYSHVEEENYNDTTILTSIKLTGSTNTDKINSDITLTAFTYDEDDFDENNEYRGISKQTITIKRS